MSPISKIRISSCLHQPAAALLLSAIGIFGSTHATAATINIDLPGGGMGTISLDPTATHEQLTGGFTAKDAAGNPMTLAQVEKVLGEDHLNWFQKVVTNLMPPPAK